MIQIEAEVLRVEAVLNEGTRYQVTRAMHTTSAASHAGGQRLFIIWRRQWRSCRSCETSSAVRPAAIGDIRFLCQMPGWQARNCLSQTAWERAPRESYRLTQTIDCGLRTLAGGQYSLQVDGFLAIQTGQLRTWWWKRRTQCAMSSRSSSRRRWGGPFKSRSTTPAEPIALSRFRMAATISNVVKGFGMPFLDAGSRIGMDITSCGLDSPGVGSHRSDQAIGAAMPEILEKLRPDRDLQCYFERPSGIAALSSTSATGFTVSGCWRQQFDWAVIEWNRDNVFEHPAFRNLPDGDLSGLQLSYEETRTNCIPLDSSWYPTVDWPYLRIWAESEGVEQCIKSDSRTMQLRLEGSYGPASAIFELQGNRHYGRLHRAGLAGRTLHVSDCTGSTRWRRRRKRWWTGSIPTRRR